MPHPLSSRTDPIVPALLNLLPALLPLFLLVLTSPLPAREGDLSAEVQVSADSSEYDERNGTQSLLGNVEISQGSLLIKADRIDVFLQKNQLDRIEGSGKPIRFEQQNDAGETIRGTANSIKYDATTGIMVLSGGATLQQPQQKLDSERIEFDARRQKVTAQGDAKGGRVSIRIQPPSDTAERVEEATGEAADESAEPDGR